MSQELPKGWQAEISDAGVLTVRSPAGEVVSVLPRGTHAALDTFGPVTKRWIENWWDATLRENRSTTKERR